MRFCFARDFGQNSLVTNGAKRAGLLINRARSLNGCIDEFRKDLLIDWSCREVPYRTSAIDCFLQVHDSPLEDLAIPETEADVLAH